MESGKKIKEFSFLLGKWSGEGWVEYEGKRYSFSQTENIYSKLNESILVVEGLGQASGKITHETFAILYREQSTNRLKFRTFETSGRSKEADVALNDGVWSWGFKEPQNKISIRFTIQLNGNGQWFEIGERTVDDQIWNKFFEMTLTRN